VGEKVGKPYLNFLMDLTADDDYWSYDPDMRLLKTKYGITHTDAWELLNKENKDTDTPVKVSVKDRHDHPADVFAKIRSDWISLRETEKPDYEEIDQKLFLIWRGCRVDAMVELLDYGKLEHLTDTQYWELVQDYWIDAEGPFRRWDDWLRLFEERETDSSLTSHLPDEVTIYRGGHQSGVSWTTSLETASWFARRFAFSHGNIPVWETTIPKQKIIFFTNLREENEVLLWEPPSPNTIKSVEPKFEKVA